MPFLKEVVRLTLQVGGHLFNVIFAKDHIVSLSGQIWYLNYAVPMQTAQIALFSAHVFMCNRCGIDHIIVQFPHSPHSLKNKTFKHDWG